MKKVTAKHLMIGDWVESRGKVKKVHGMSPFTNKIGLNKYIYDGEIQHDYVNSATPIPITEEWLILNGWNQSPLTTQIMYGKSISKDLTMFYTMRDKSVMVSLFKENTADYERQASLIGCTYIHQLQQAYRLATGGKELKIKF